MENYPHAVPSNEVRLASQERTTDRDALPVDDDLEAKAEPEAEETESREKEQTTEWTATPEQLIGIADALNGEINGIESSAEDDSEEFEQAHAEHLKEIKKNDETIASEKVAVDTVVEELVTIEDINNHDPNEVAEKMARLDSHLDTIAILESKNASLHQKIEWLLDGFRAKMLGYQDKLNELKESYESVLTLGVDRLVRSRDQEINDTAQAKVAAAKERLSSARESLHTTIYDVIPNIAAAGNELNRVQALVRQEVIALSNKVRELIAQSGKGETTSKDDVAILNLNRRSIAKRIGDVDTAHVLAA